MGLEPELALGLLRELLVRLEPGRLVQLGLLRLLTLRLRKLEPLDFEPALALEAPLLLRLLVELEKQLALQLAQELQHAQLQVVGQLRQAL